MSNRPNVLLLGASGQIGFGIASILRGCAGEIDLTVSVRENHIPWAIHLFSPCEVVSFDCQLDTPEKLEFSKFDWVINCIGVTKHVPGSNNLRLLTELNTHLPARLADLAERFGVGLIHISTDCVFRGDDSRNYTELTAPDALDNYGRSKAVAEEIRTTGLVLRTSTMGIEFFSNGGLLNWIFSNRNKRIRGFSKAFFTGITSRELGRVVAKIVVRDRTSGLFNLAGPKMSKLQVIQLIDSHFKLNIDIAIDETFWIDRSLDGALFVDTFGFKPRGIGECLFDFSFRGQL